MDRSWMKESRSSKPYIDGISNFIKFALEKASIDGAIYCPCRKCFNRYSLPSQTVHEHLLWNGMLEGYNRWVFHGESLLCSSRDQPNRSNDTNSITSQSNLDGEYDMQGLLSDIFRTIAPSEDNDDSNVDESVLGSSEACSLNGMEEHAQRGLSPTIDNSHPLQQLMQDYDKELYPGCSKFSKLSFTLRLYHLKCLNGWSSKSFNMLLELLKNAFPCGNSVPSSHYEAKKIIKDLGLGYQKIDACPNDCILYWGDKENLEHCSTCSTSRWEINKDDNCQPKDDENDQPMKKKPAKVLRYFPLIPRLKRLFMSSKTASSMTWHVNGRNKDGLYRHPADALAWTEFDKQYPDFAADPRNVRLGLASDGFNPFRTMSTTYSTWPVVLIPYNLEPWVCMKQSSLILSMVIPGEKGPGNDIDVFLQPLIAELQQLWVGVDAYDAYTKKNFKLRAALMWTINDFPAYANLSGWSTKGRVACPHCADSTHSQWLSHGRKFCYLGHRMWLDPDHAYRYEKDQFDGSEELRTAPKPPSGTEILRQLHGVNFSYGKASKSRGKRNRNQDESSKVPPTNELPNDNRDGTMFADDDYFLNECENLENVEGDMESHCLWKKRSIFFDLVYWPSNLIRHNFDVMHIEKNVCDNLINTFLNVDGKSKDNYKARLDIVEMGIRHELHPTKVNNVTRYPPACYTMTPKEKELFLTVLKYMKVPDGYASNISRCVNLKDRRLTNLKSHDCHILMQDILPIALRSCMPPQIVSVVSALSSFFKELCSKTLDPLELDRLQSKLVLTLCQLEKLFVPGFFTVMVHLTVHLVAEAKLGGPVQYRWMYPIERGLVRFKSLVRNRAHPEGSIAEGYVADECLIFCSRYLEGVESVINRSQRNFDQIGNPEMFMFSTGGRVLGKIESVVLDEMALEQVHRYVILHCDQISPYRSEFLAAQRRSHRRNRSNPHIEQKWLLEKFSQWLLNQVTQMVKNNESEEIISIARGPNNVCRQFSGFIVNGFRFHTRKRERLRKTQNSGVVVEVDGKPYYGVLTDIIELDYYRKFKVVMFKCDWVNVNSSMGLKRDANGCTLVNFSRLIHTGQSLKDDPYIFSSQAKQVFYVQDPKHPEWFQVIHTKPRDLYDMGATSQMEDDGSYTQCMSYMDAAINVNEQINWAREELDEQNAT